MAKRSDTPLVTAAEWRRIRETLTNRKDGSWTRFQEQTGSHRSTFGRYCSGDLEAKDIGWVTTFVIPALRSFELERIAEKIEKRL